MGDIYNSTELQNAAEESQSIASFSLTDGVTLEQPNHPQFGIAKLLWDKNTDKELLEKTDWSRFTSKFTVFQNVLEWFILERNDQISPEDSKIVPFMCKMLFLYPGSIGHNFHDYNINTLSSLWNIGGGG